MLREIVPGHAAVAEAVGEAADAPLFPEEEAAVPRAAGRRRREFATGRACARQALSDLGVHPAPIGRGARGAPDWPDTIVGSITHCSGYCAAVVARADCLPAIGIDAEPHLPLPDGVASVVARPAELSRLARLRRSEPGFHWDRLLFSAKESVYKAWFPLTRRWLGFQEAEIDLRADGSFLVRILDGPASAGLAHDQPAGFFAGQWIITRDLILTAVTVGE